MQQKKERAAAFNAESTNLNDFTESEKLPGFMALLSEVPGQFSPTYLALNKNNQH